MTNYHFNSYFSVHGLNSFSFFSSGGLMLWSGVLQTKQSINQEKENQQINNENNI